VAKAGKRKRGSEHSDDDVSSNASDADESPDEDSDEDGDTFVSPTKKSRYTRESSSQAGGVTVHAPKRQAKAKSSTADKTTAPRHGRKKGTAAKAAAAGADLAKQLPISSDNALFSKHSPSFHRYLAYYTYRHTDEPLGGVDVHG
jgi:hypothetical protein